jgi:hypothetical protein
MSILYGTNRYKHAERPPACPDCAGPTWWNGTRHVCEYSKPGRDLEFATDVVRRRVRCPVKDCPRNSWTLYDNTAYPHRIFSLDLVISAVSAVVFARGTLTGAAQAHGCGRDSIRRWVAWVEQLAEPQDLLQACTRLEPRGVPGGLDPSSMSRAAANLHLFDRLADLLAERGVRATRAIGRGTAATGLVRILQDQLARWGAVFYLTQSSPPLRADLAGVCL